MASTVGILNFNTVIHPIILDSHDFLGRFYQ